MLCRTLGVPRSKFWQGKLQLIEFTKKYSVFLRSILAHCDSCANCCLGVDSGAKRLQMGFAVGSYIKSMFVIENKTECRILTHLVKY